MPDCDVTYHAVDELPGGAAVILAVRGKRLDVLISSAATAEQLASDLNRLYCEMWPARWSLNVVA